jgi:predicted Zn-dependent protease
MTLASCATLALAGCESDEDRAEAYFQSGLALLEEGDKERAALELRNVFDHDGFHKEARMLYAQLMVDLERPAEAYGQYLRLIEQYPDTSDARVALAKMALAQNNWPEVERHGTAAIELAPENPEVRAIDLASRYRTAALEEDTEARNAIAVEAETLLADLRAKDPTKDNDALVRLMIDNALFKQQPAKALEIVNAALERAPQLRELNILKVRLLAEVDDREGTEAHLKKMVTMFPENDEIKQAMVRWFMTQNDVASAEAFLRERAGEDTGPTEGHVEVLQLLQTTQGVAAARAELVRLQAANPDTENGNFYTGMIAALDFQTGERDQAIEDMRGAIAASETGAQKIRLQVTLAEMLRATGDTSETQALVDAVLEEDAGNVTALQLRAAHLIQGDKTGEAIVALRTALDQEPRNADTLTLLAQAHERDGDTNLVGERLAMAMEASGNAVPQVMRYSRFLLAQDRPQVAVTVLEDGSRRNPGNLEVLRALANLHMRNNSWDEAQAIVTQLSTGSGDAQRLATDLEARILQRSDRTEESLALLREQLDETSGTTTDDKTRAIGLIVQTQIRSGKMDAARETLDTALADKPDNTGLRLINAALSAVEGNLEQAETIYRQLVEEYPQSEVPVRLLVSMLAGTGQRDKAHEVLDAALVTLPDRPSLMSIKAGFLEQDSDFDGAIALYEQLYELNSGNPVLANNLASLITTHKDDADSLARAANIARRLRGTEVPAFQDTYGWIAYRRENFEEAVEYLEPAAAGLPRDALVQFHLGMAYVALNRNADAKAQLESALELAGDNPLPQFELARETLAGLE